MQPLASIPSPSQGVWHLGPFPLRAYALMIILGIIVAVWLGERRWTARGGTPGVVVDCAVWAVPFGLVGGRLYHVITDYQRYFGEGREPINALKVWEGGLGIWGAVVMGGVGAWIGCRRRGVSVAALGDAVAPGIALAQGIGRWGNWWNQELYGRPLDAWWAVQIDPAHRPQLDDGTLDPKYADVATYHPTFLYESLWCVGVAVFVIWAGRRYRLTHGRTFALYVAAYTVGRAWIEFLRIDDAHHILGLRLNDWTSLLVFLGAVAFILRTRDKTGPEAVMVTGRYAEAGEPAGAEPAEAGEPAGEETGREETGREETTGKVPAEAEAPRPGTPEPTSSERAAESEAEAGSDSDSDSESESDEDAAEEEAGDAEPTGPARAEAAVPEAEDRTEEDRTEEDRTEEDRTEEDRTEEDRTDEEDSAAPPDPAEGTDDAPAEKAAAKGGLGKADD